ncbi:MAG: leucine-rich repeat domain-containing protein, partial [Bacteroidaceae bacterium]|nr:leucine-rich repeat domain-containing protein [Bacteroidaceae bacterium]
DFVFKVVDGVNILSEYIGNAVDLVLPDNYKNENYVIGENAFRNCSGLTSIEIPTSVTSIGEAAFRNCSGLTSIIIPNSVTSIGSSAFEGCTGLTSITIPNSVTSIGNGAFNGCAELISVEFNAENCTSMGSSSSLVFADCTSLSTLTFGENVKKIPAYAFKGCSNLTTVIIPDNVTNVGNNAFDSCSNLETLCISNTIESIGAKAFANCNKILEIKIGAKIAIEASEDIFNKIVYNNACLYVPSGRKFAYEKTSPWKNFYILEMDYTGIDEVKGEDENVEVVYDLQGRKVETPTKGIYIINGKKKLVK